MSFKLIPGLALAAPLRNAAFQLKYRRLFLPALLLSLFVLPTTREVVSAVMIDAFLQVSAFVAATLVLYHAIKYRLPSSVFHWLNARPTLELVYASVLGALPGCGGAIIVVTQFTQKKASFGAVVAVLTATMGDAAFVLLAQQPDTGLSIMLAGVIVGIASGFVVNQLHPSDFLVPEVNVDVPKTSGPSNTPKVARLSAAIWLLLFFPALSLAIAGAFQWDTSGIIPSHWREGFALVAAFLCLGCWALSSEGMTYQDITAEDKGHSEWIIKTAQDTNFVTAWVVSAFLLFELSMLLLGLDLNAVFSSYAALFPLFGVLIGLLPGCGPQILVTSLYVQGVVPFSAQLSNAISNDGDALFPAIALAPKAAVIATLYSAIPALLLGYGYYLLFEPSL